MKTNTKIVNIGKFQIRINKSCAVEWPTDKPEYNPVEFECIKGSYDGELLAKSIATMTKSSPVSPLVVEHNLAECKLNADIRVSFSIYHTCENEEFIKAYNKYFSNLKKEMLDKGYEYVKDKDGQNGSFVYTAEE